MRRILCLLALTVPSIGGATTPITIQFRVTVRPVCEVWATQPTVLTLRCTRDYHPQDPAQLPELLGKLPAGTWTYRDSAPATAPGGGSLNVYDLTTAESSTQVDFY